jgi:uncharacterized repeat protein (TIGR01451 family)
VVPPALGGCFPATASLSNATTAPVPDNTTVDSTIAVTGAGHSIYDVEVYTTIASQFGGDVDLDLEAPSGRIVTLTSDNGGGNDNTFRGTLWDDQADPGSTLPYAVPPPHAVETAYVDGVAKPTLVPEEPLASFQGEDPNGTWTLHVTDDAASDVTVLEGWELRLTTTAATPRIRTQRFSAAPNAPVNDVSSMSTTLNVAGVPGRIWRVVPQTALRHTFAADIDMALTSPSAAVATLTTDSGGNRVDSFDGTVWDAGADGFTTNPTNARVRDFPNATGHAAPALTPEESASFTGQDPNGTWTLTIVDDAPSNTGTLDDWSLAIESGVCEPADVAVAMTTEPAAVTAGGVATYVVTLRNDGPGAAEGVSVADTLPAGAALVAATPSQGTCTGGTCNIGALPAGASAQVAVLARLANTGDAVNSATVSAQTADPDASDNSASATTRVNPVPTPPTPPTPPTSPSQAAPDAPPSVVVLAGSPQKLKAALAKGVSALTACSEACSITATLSVDSATARRLKLPSQVIGTVTKRLTAAGTTSLQVRILAAAKRKLAGARSLKLTLTATATDSAGQTGSHSSKLTLKR